MKRNSTTVAFAALLALGAIAGPAMAQQQRNVDGGPPQQGMPGPVNQQAAPQANYMVDYHADYRVKRPDEPKADATPPGASSQPESSRNQPSPGLERMLGRTPGAWGR